LYSVLEGEKQPYFVSALKITGIPFAPAPAPAPAPGGMVTGGYPKGTYKKSRRSKNITSKSKSKRVLQQSGGAPLTEPEEKELIENEIKDTELVIELYEEFVKIVNERPEDIEQTVESLKNLKTAEEEAKEAEAEAKKAEKGVDGAVVGTFGTKPPRATPPRGANPASQPISPDQSQLIRPSEPGSEPGSVAGSADTTQSQGGGALTRNELTKINGLMNEFSRILVGYEKTGEELSEDIDITQEDYFQCECIHARFAINYPQFEVMKQILIKFMDNQLLASKVIGLLDRIEKLQTGDESNPYQSGAPGIELDKPIQLLGKRKPDESEPPSPIERENTSSGSEDGSGGRLPRPGKVPRGNHGAAAPPTRKGGSKTLKINKKIQKRTSNYQSQTAKHKR
jgi:hypothetical protein